MTEHGGDPATPAPQERARLPCGSSGPCRARRGVSSPVLWSIWPRISNTPLYLTRLLYHKACHGQGPPPVHTPCSSDVSRLFWASCVCLKVRDYLSSHTKTLRNLVFPALKLKIVLYSATI